MKPCIHDLGWYRELSSRELGPGAVSYQSDVECMALWLKVQGSNGVHGYLAMTTRQNDRCDI